MGLRYSKHARDRMRKRGVTTQEVEQVLRQPDLSRPGDPGKTVYERRLGRVVCVVTVDDSDPQLVVTVFTR